MFNKFWLFLILTIQIEYFALRSPISGISFLTNLNKTSSLLLHEFNDFRFVIILLYWPYWSLFYLPYRTEFEQGQLKDIHNWGQGYKKCSKIIAFLTYTHCYFIKACCLNSQQGETLLLFWYSLFIQSASIIM